MGLMKEYEFSPKDLDTVLRFFFPQEKIYGKYINLGSKLHL